MKEKEIISKVRIYDYEELSEADRELIDKAKEATQTSYAPFSKFCVGRSRPAVRRKDCNGKHQENAAFPSSLCAERTALFYANARYPEKSVEELAIAAYAHGAFLKAPIPPCGACRQVILGVEERYGHPVRILLFGERGYLRGRFGQSPTPLAVYRRNHERIKYFSYLCRKYSIQGII